jgi:ABC-type thiamin/hydroxymethylpyrimidine transport system permease subunit
MKFSTKELVTLAVFGTLWGISEITLGTVLKSINLPISGILLSTIGLIIALVGRVFVPRKGSTLFVGVIAMLLKLFSLGGVIIGPMVGIITEAVVAEIILSALGKPRRLSLMLAGAAGVLWVLLQPFITNPLLFGRTLLDVWFDLLRRGSQLIGLDQSAVVGILLLMVAVHVLIGGLAGFVSWELGHQLEARLGRGPAVESV